jgi:hypothetical protein
VIDFEADVSCEQLRGTSSESIIVATATKIQPFVLKRSELHARLTKFVTPVSFGRAPRKISYRNLRNFSKFAASFRIFSV